MASVKLHPLWPDSSAAMQDSRTKTHRIMVGLRRSPCIILDSVVDLHHEHGVIQRPHDTNYILRARAARPPFSNMSY